MYNREKLRTEFREFLNESFIIESFDTSHIISKVEKGNPDFYYFSIDDKEFRIFVEKAEDDNKSLHIGFEYLIPDKGWTIYGIHNTLSAKEILGIFGTIYNVLQKYKFNALMFCSSEHKKFRTYVRLATRLANSLNIKEVTHNNECIFLFNVDHNLKPKFKYKSNK